MNKIQKHVLEHVDEVLDDLNDVRLIGAWAELIPFVMKALESYKDCECETGNVDVTHADIIAQQWDDWAEYESLSNVKQTGTQGVLEKAERDHLQAKIDSLMLEFCPDEMTQEQLDSWAAHQIPSNIKVVRT